uniref:Uncharacterized protein n=1 Tax=Rhizophora mucronata TaxID=61149 RepID=A0A2P2QBK7_RHIMU
MGLRFSCRTRSTGFGLPRKPEAEWPPVCHR